MLHVPAAGSTVAIKNTMRGKANSMTTRFRLRRRQVGVVCFVAGLGGLVVAFVLGPLIGWGHSALLKISVASGLFVGIGLSWIVIDVADKRTNSIHCCGR
jgi:hypothetical protein